VDDIGAEDAAALERRIAAVEAATGVQVVTAVVPRADDYPEAPWRAFALGVAVASLAGVGLDVGRPDWVTPGALLAQALLVLAAGSVLALAARYVDAVRRRFVPDERAAGEARQCAEALFLARELFATPRRDAVLILVARLERRVVVVPDSGYRGRVAAHEWQAVVDAMTPRLASGALREAFDAGLAALQAVLVGKGFAPGDGRNPLPDAIVRGDAP
jgi:uncharacterized membrane protein